MEKQNVCYFQMYLLINYKKSPQENKSKTLHCIKHIHHVSMFSFLGPSTYVGINSIESNAENQQKIAVFLTPPTSLFADVMVPKGQLISKCPFGVFKSPKKTTDFFQEFLPQPLKRGQIKKIRALYAANWRILF